MRRYIVYNLDKYENVRIFSFDNIKSITNDLANYIDTGHYTPVISSELLRFMADGDYQLTKDNYDAYEKDFIENVANYTFYVGKP